MIAKIKSRNGTMKDKNTLVEASRRIEAPATTIFKILAAPKRSIYFDGFGHALGRRIRASHLPDGRYLHHETAWARRRLLDDQPWGGVRARSAHLLGTSSRRLFSDGGQRFFQSWYSCGLRWGYILTPENYNATLVTEVFDCGNVAQETRQLFLHDGGRGSMRITR